MLQLDDLTDPRPDNFALTAPQAEQQSADGWTGLMRLASDFPLGSLSCGAVTGLPAVDVPTIVLPKPRSFSSALASDRLADLIDSAGDGPLIGLGAGMSLAGH